MLSLTFIHQRKGQREREDYNQTIWWRDGDIVKIISFDVTNNELKSSIVQRSKVPNTHTLKYYYVFKRKFVISSIEVIDNVIENAQGINFTLILCIEQAT